MDYPPSYQHVHLHQCLTVKRQCGVKQKKNLVFYVFIKSDHGYKSGQLMNLVKIDPYHKNGQKYS